MDLHNIGMKLFKGIPRKELKEVGRVIRSISRAESLNRAMELVVAYIDFKDPDDLHDIIEQFLENLVSLSDAETHEILILAIKNIALTLFKMSDEFDSGQFENSRKFFLDVIGREEKDREESTSLSYILAILITTLIVVLEELDSNEFEKQLNRELQKQFSLSFVEIREKLKNKFNTDIFQLIKGNG